MISGPRLIQKALERCEGIKLKAAEFLGINRNTLRKRLGQLDIDPARP